jgi:hypothetical protein
MTLLELVENYGPIVYANSELGFIIQRNGAYLNWGRKDRDGWSHIDCRAVEADAYETSLAKAMGEAEQWAKEIMTSDDNER